MIGPRLKRHPLDLLAVVDRPTSEELGDYYAQTYYQPERGSFRQENLPEELHMINLQIEPRGAQPLPGHNRPGILQDVGCDKGFVLTAVAGRGRRRSTSASQMSRA